MSEEEKAGWQLPEKALRAFHFRAVQRIYGEQGAQVRSCACGWLQGSGQRQVVLCAVLCSRRGGQGFSRLQGGWRGDWHASWHILLPHPSAHAHPPAAAPFYTVAGGGAAAPKPGGCGSHCAQPPDAEGLGMAAGAPAAWDVCMRSSARVACFTC